MGSLPGPVSLMYGGMLYQLALIIVGHLHFSANQRTKRLFQTFFQYYLEGMLVSENVMLVFEGSSISPVLKRTVSFIWR